MIFFFVAWIIVVFWAGRSFADLAQNGFSFMQFFDKSSGQDSCREGKERDSSYNCKGPDNFSGKSHRIHIPIPDRSKGDDPPPHGLGDAREFLRLDIVFGKKHKAAEYDKDHKKDGKGDEQFFLCFCDDPVEDLNCFCIPSELEDPDYPEQSQDPDEPEVDREEHREIKRQEREEIDEGIGRYHVPESPGYRVAETRVERTDPEPYDILNRENGDGDDLNEPEKKKKLFIKRPLCFKDNGEQVDYDKAGHEIIEIPCSPISIRALLNHPVYFFL